MCRLLCRVTLTLYTPPPLTSRMKRNATGVELKGFDRRVLCASNSLLKALTVAWWCSSLDPNVAWKALSAFCCKSFDWCETADVSWLVVGVICGWVPTCWRAFTACFSTRPVWRRASKVCSGACHLDARLPVNLCANWFRFVGVIYEKSDSCDRDYA